MAQLGINVSNIAPAEGMDPVPAGWYIALIEKSEIEPTKSTDGLRLTFVWKIVDGQFTGRKIFSGHNLRNSNAQAVEIAMKELSAIGHAINVLDIQDSQQLHNQPMKIKVKLRPAEGQYEARNEITGWKNVNEVVGTGQPAAQQAPTGYTVPPVAPPAAAPQQWAPPPQPVQQAPAPTAAPAWQPPAAAQPWQQAPQQAAAPAWQAPAPTPQAPPQQAAPAPVQQAAAPVQQWAPPPQQAAQPPVQQTAQQAPPPWATQPPAGAPSWNGAPAQ